MFRKWAKDVANNMVGNIMAAALISGVTVAWAYLLNAPGYAIFLAGLFAVGGVLFLFNQLRRLSLFSSGENIQAIAGQNFRDCQVVLDGRAFVDCTFQNVIFRWDGGPFSVIRASIQGSRRLETKKAEVADTVDLLKALGFLEPTFANDWRRQAIL